MFRLSWDEADEVLRSQIVILDGETSDKPLQKMGCLRSQTVTLKRGQHRKFRPYAFTEQGVAMLSSVLSSPRAVQVNIAIMRAFVQLWQILGTHADLARKLKALEGKYDAQFKAVFDAIRELMDDSKPAKRGTMGFHTLMPARSASPGKPGRKRLS